MEVQVIHDVLKANDEIARMVRERFEAERVLALNLISAPGSGKTSLIESAIRSLRDSVRIGVIEGDPDTTRDADRIAQLGIPVIQINTAGGCHLHANQVFRSLVQFNLGELDLVFIENVGNLVCPVEFDLGEAACVAVVSTSEGHDKPAKYPKLFRTAAVAILNKIDLLPYVDFDEAQFSDDLNRLNPSLPLLRLSCRSGEEVEQWADWIRQRLVR